MITKTLNHLKGFSRLPVLWLIACLAGSGWLLSLGAAATKQTPQAASTIDDSPSHVTKRIEDVKAGDHVWAFDTVTRQWSAKAVLKPLVHDYQGDLVTVTVRGRSVQCTGNHPFWIMAGDQLNDRTMARDVPESDRHRADAVGRWVAARDLQAGDVLALRDGRFAPIDMVTIRQAPPMKVYNLQVADLHTYAVGDLGIAVHNKCFPPGTLILMGDGSAKPIEQVQVGDWVLSQNDKGRITRAEVGGVIRDYAEVLDRITFQSDQGLSSIVSTRSHPFWTENRGWVEAKSLRPGDELLCADGARPLVLETAPFRHAGRTYNLSINDTHAYFALALDSEPILTHNSVITDTGLPYQPVPAGNQIVPSPYYPPNNGFAAGPDLGSFLPGDTFQRFGGLGGSYVSPIGTPPGALSLPPNVDSSSPSFFRVAPDSAPISVDTGPASAWFGQPGGGTQMKLPGGQTVQQLLDNGSIQPISSSN